MVPEAAARQSGVFTRGQALDEGWTRSQVDHRLGCGAWRRLAGRALVRGDVTPSAWSGVWAVHLTWPDAVASHTCAAFAHRMPVPAGPVHAIGGAGLRSLRDLVVHRVDLPDADLVRVVGGGPLLTTARNWRERLSAVKDWSAWLAEGDEAEELATLRRNVGKGLPCGAESFLDRLEKLAGRPLRVRPIGRPRRPEQAAGGQKG